MEAKRIPAPARPSLARTLVKQMQLQDVVDKRALKFDLQKQLAQLDDELVKMEAVLKAKISAGARVEAGALKATVVTTFRRSPRWKEIMVRHLGEEVVEAELKATPATPTETLVIAPTARDDAST